MSQTFTDNTSKTTAFGAVSKDNTGTSSLTADLELYLKHLYSAQNAAHLVRVFSCCSDATGGYVQLRSQNEYIPVLIGANDQSVPLYHFVEVLDEVLDYDSIIKEIPFLSYSQIGGAISFLRGISQINPKGIDLDALEDQQLSEDSLFLDELRKALADKETARVLNRD